MHLKARWCQEVQGRRGGVVIGRKVVAEMPSLPSFHTTLVKHPVPCLMGGRHKVKLLEKA